MKPNRYDVSLPSVVCMCIAGVAGAAIIHRLGLPQKWQFVLVVTLAPFWYIVGVLRPRWSLPSLWISLAAYFAAHVLLVWIFFGALLGGVSRVPFVYAVPLTMLEGLLLLMAVDGLERKIRGKCKLRPSHPQRPRIGGA